MEPIDASNLTGAIPQFVDSATRFAALAQRLYQHGSADAGDHAYLLNIIEDLDAVAPELKPTRNDGDGAKSIAQPALGCGKTATRLLAILKQGQKNRRCP